MVRCTPYLGMVLFSVESRDGNGGTYGGTEVANSFLELMNPLIGIHIHVY